MILYIFWRVISICRWMKRKWQNCFHFMVLWKKWKLSPTEEGSAKGECWSERMLDCHTSCYCLSPNKMPFSSSLHFFADVITLMKCDRIQYVTLTDYLPSAKLILNRLTGMVVLSRFRPFGAVGKRVYDLLSECLSWSPNLKLRFHRSQRCMKLPFVSIAFLRLQVWICLLQRDRGHSVHHRGLLKSVCLNRRRSVSQRHVLTCPVVTSCVRSNRWV